MMQQINLYEARPETDIWKNYYPWPQVCTGLLGLLVVITLFLVWEQYRLGSQLAQLQQPFEASRVRLEQLNQQATGKGVNTSLERRVNQLEQEVRDKQATLAVIGMEKMSNFGFSRHLQGLARQPVEGLWLTHIEFFEGGKQIGLEGLTSKPEYVPRLIRNLGAETAFSGTEFDIFQLKQRGNLLVFTVSADREQNK